MKDTPAANGGLGGLGVLWLQFIFLVSGVSQTILVNLVSYHGGASPVESNEHLPMQ